MNGVELKTIAAAIRINSENRDADRDYLRTAASMTALRERMEKHYPGLREVAEAITAVEQQQGIYHYLEDLVGKGATLVEAEGNRFDELDEECSKTRDESSSKIGSNVLDLYATICDEEARLLAAEREEPAEP